MADKNFTMHRYNGTSFDTLYPETTIEQVNDLQDELDAKEITSNKVIEISSSSTDLQYPSAKIVYDSLSNVVRL